MKLMWRERLVALRSAMALMGVCQMVVSAVLWNSVAVAGADEVRLTFDAAAIAGGMDIGGPREAPARSLLGLGSPKSAASWGHKVTHSATGGSDGVAVPAVVISENATVLV